MPLPVISSVINNPAILAVQRVTKHPDINDLKTTFVNEDFLSGASADSEPIMIPIEAGFAKLQMANVAIAADLIYGKK